MNTLDTKNKRNRKRSQRRKIYCPKDRSPLHSVSQKYPLYADSIEQLSQRGVTRLNASILLNFQSPVPLSGEWVEGFWCDECQQTEWYHIRRLERSASHQASEYEVLPVSPAIWQQVSGVIDPMGNASVGEFTKRQSRALGNQSVKDFGFVRS